MRASLSSADSTPFGAPPSITPMTPLPWADFATTALEDVDRERVLDEDDERVAAPDLLRVLLRESDERVIVTLGSDQARAARLAESDSELDAHARLNESLVDVLDRLDEVGLAEDEVQLLRILDLNELELNRHFLNVK